MEHSADEMIVEADALKEQALLASDEVMMYHVKVDACTKAYPHDFNCCPWLHPGERARRRDPRAFGYCSTLCPDVKKDKVCMRGINCPYSHNIFEYYLHPARYRTRMCDFGEQCKRTLCFFAHNPEQLRVTAKSLAAAQAQANSGKGKGNSSKPKNSNSSSDLQTSGASPKSDDADAVRAAQLSADAGSSSAGRSPAAVEFLQKVCADETALALLLQTLGAANDSSIDGATAAVIKALLEPQQDSLSGKLAGSSASCDSLLGGGSDTHGSDGSSPRTPVQQVISLPAEAAAAQRKDTVLRPSPGAGPVSSSAGTGKGSYSCSVQEHIQNVMEGRVTADQVQRDTARVLDNRAAAGARAFTPFGESVGAPCAPLELLHLASAHSPAAGSTAHMQRASMDLMSPGMHSYLTDGPLGSPEFIPLACMGRANSAFAHSAARPAQLQVSAFSGDLGALSSSAISSYGAGCFLQTAGSLDTFSSNAAGGFSGQLPGMSSNSCNVGGTAGLSSFLSIDSNSGHLGAGTMLSTDLLHKLSLQQGAAAGAAGSLSSPLIRAPNMMPGLQSSAQSAAAAAATQQQLLQAEMAQQQAAMLLQQQQTVAAAGVSPGPVQAALGRNGRGVSSMLGSVSGVGVFGTYSPAMAAWC